MSRQKWKKVIAQVQVTALDHVALAVAFHDADRGGDGLHPRRDSSCRVHAHLPRAQRRHRARAVALVALSGCPQGSRLRQPAGLPPSVRAARRRARSSGAATTKIFTSASGQTTVPMSRPSSTAPGGVAANSRWNSAAPHGLAGSPIRSKPPHRSRGLSGLFVERVRIERPRRRDRVRCVIERMARIEHCLRDRAIDQPGVEMAQAKCVARRLPSVPLPDAAGPSIAMIMRITPLRDRRRDDGFGPAAKDALL